MKGKSGRSKAEKKNGQKWVETNYDAKKQAREDNDGKLPYSVALETSYHPLSSSWSTENLPEVLFYLKPPPSPYANRIPNMLIDEETGGNAKSDEGRAIKDYEILPRYISIEVEGWMVEAWRRIDSRIQYPDIRDRQRNDPTFGRGIGIKKLKANALQNHCRRDCRRVLNNWVEYGRRDEPHRTEVEAIEGLSYDNVTYNTVLSPSEKLSNRLVKLAFKKRTEDGFWYAEPMKVTSINYLETTFDIRHFIGAALPGLSDDNYMTKSMYAAWELSLILQERAERHGKQHWSKLERDCLPVTWYDRLGDKKTTSNLNYDNGCAICTWTQDRDETIAPVSKRTSRPLATSRKHVRARSDSNSDEPLMKKRKRARIANLDTHSDDDGEMEPHPFDNPPLLPPSSSSPAFMTPVRTRRSLRVINDVDEDYDAEMEEEEVDDDATELVLLSERRVDDFSSPLGNAKYRNAMHFGSTDSPLAPYSNSPYETEEDPYQSAAVQNTATWPQPLWIELGFGTEAKFRSHSQPQEPSDNDSAAMVYAMRDSNMNRRPISFTSTTTLINQSLSGKMEMVTTASTPFDSEDELINPQYGLQRSSVSLQRVIGLGQHVQEHPYPTSHYHPGRETVHGSRLSDVFSSPPKMNRDFDNMANMYQSRSFISGNPYSRRHSFETYQLPDQSLTPYGEKFANNWAGDDLSFTGSHLHLQDVAQSIDDGFNNLLQAPRALNSPHPRSKATNFSDLLSSDPIMPEEHEAFGVTYDTMESNYKHILHEPEAAAGESITKRAISHTGRRTPPYLDQ